MSAALTLTLLGFSLNTDGTATREMPDGRVVELRGEDGAVLVEVRMPSGARLAWWRRDLTGALKVLVEHVF